MNKKLNIEKLINECCEGSEKAWREFIQEFNPLISGCIFKICNIDSEDVVQIVYEKLIKNNYTLLSRFDGCLEQFIVYLMNISKNSALSYRKNVLKRTIPLVDIDMYAESDSPYNSTENERIGEEDEIFLNEIIDELKPHYREVLNYLGKGYNHREISEILGIPLNTVLTRSNRAKEILRKIVKN